MNTFPTPKPDTMKVPTWIYVLVLCPMAVCSILALAMAFLVRLP